MKQFKHFTRGFISTISLYQFTSLLVFTFHNWNCNEILEIKNRYIYCIFNCIKMIIFNEILKINKFIYFLYYFISIVIHIVVQYSLKNNMYFKRKKFSFERIII